METLRVGIGSRNPVKIAAVRDMFPPFAEKLGIRGEVDYAGYDVPSGVPAQPLGIEEIYRGAVNRARAVMELASPHFAIGLEAGIYAVGEYHIDTQMCAVLDNAGTITIGHSGGFTYPPEVIDEVRKGREIGDIFATLSGNDDIKRQEGAIGMLSEGWITRREFSCQSVQMALIPRINQKK